MMITLDTKIMDWAKEVFSAQELEGYDVNEEATFEAVEEILTIGEDFYDYTGLEDTSFRNKCMMQLAAITGKPYSMYYNMATACF